MTTLQNKIDFAVVFSVKNANPNGDPLNGNRPRTDYAGLGEVTDVCIKRKIRDRMVERFVELHKTGSAEGQGVFVQSDDRKIDEFKSLRDRAAALLKDKRSSDETAKLACQTWLDVRTFGQLFAFAAGKKGKNDGEGDSGISIGIRGPVTVQSAFSIEPVSITSTQITKSVSGEGDGSKRGSDTMGMKHRVDHGIYVCFGSMSPQLAERTGFSDADAATLKGILPRMFENDASSARPDGTMQVLNVYWWEHNCKAGQYSSAKVHQSLQVDANGHATLADMPGLVPECIPGF